MVLPPLMLAWSTVIRASTSCVRYRARRGLRVWQLSAVIQICIYQISNDQLVLHLIVARQETNCVFGNKRTDALNYAARATRADHDIETKRYVVGSNNFMPALEGHVVSFEDDW